MKPSDPAEEISFVPASEERGGGGGGVEVFESRPPYVGSPLYQFPNSQGNAQNDMEY